MRTFKMSASGEQEVIMSTGRCERFVTLQLWAGILLLAAFAVLCVERFLHARGRHEMTADVDLRDELSRAEFLDNPLPADADWPQWRGLHRDGVAPGNNLLTAWPAGGPKQLWEAEVGRAYSSFAVADGRVYTMERNGEREEIVCLEPRTGKVLWREGYEQPDVPERQYGPQPRSTPAVADGLVYSVGVRGRFQCRDASTGELQWEHDLVGEYGAPVPKWGMAFSPLVDGDLVFATPGGSNASVIAFDRKTGRLAWKAFSDKPGYSSPIAVTLDGERLVVTLTGESLLGLTATEGSPRFRFLWQEKTADVNAATPLAFRTRLGDVERLYLFISSGYDKGCALLNIRKEGSVFKVEQIYANNRMRCHFSSPVRYGDHVYGFDEVYLTCMDLRTGEVRWRDSKFVKGSLILAGDHLLVLGERGNLAAVKATPDAFEMKSEVRRLFSGNASRCWTAPALAHGLLFARNEDRTICLDLHK
jgi:outer membrane protein assembly factor BamB